MDSKSLQRLLIEFARDAQSMEEAQREAVARQRAEMFWQREGWRLRAEIEAEKASAAQVAKQARQRTDREVVLRFCHELQTRRNGVASEPYTKDELARKAADHFIKGGAVTIDGREIRPTKAPAQSTIRRWLRG